MTQVTNSSTGAGDTTTYAYYGYPDTQIQCPRYDSARQGGRTNIVAYGLTIATDADGHQAKYCYDTHDRVYSAIDAQGHTRSSSYTLDDNVTQFTAPSGAPFSTTYDSQDRPTGGSLPASGAGQSSAVYRLSYSQVPGCASPCHPYEPDTSTDPQGNQLSYGYDLHNNLETITSQLAAQSTLSVSHNADGTINASTDADGNQTSYGYDSHGNLTSLTPPPASGPPTPLGSVGPIGYDAASRVSSYRDGRGQVTSYRYDNMDRVTETDYADGSSVKYSYDPDGNLQHVTDSSNGTTDYAYDQKGRIISQSDPRGLSTTYSYDPVNNLLSLADNGGTATYGYDSLNRLTSIQEPGTSSPITLGYDLDDRRTSISDPNGVRIANGYDPAGNLTSTKAVNGSGTITSLSYSYTQGANDRVLVQSVTDQQSGTQTNYSYDPLNRLTEADSFRGSTATRKQSYSYDGAGNMLQAGVAADGVNWAYSTMAYNPDNEICWKLPQQVGNPGCATPPSGATTYSFDQNGNETGNSAGLALAYNARDQTTSIAAPGQQAISLGYATDGQGQLDQTGNLGTLQNNLVGLGRLDSYGWDYTRANDSTLLTERAGAYGDYYYVADNLGSVIALTDPNGNTANTYQYDPYGNTIGASGGAGNTFGYAGGQYVADGLYHFGARYYDPSIGRWTQQDPITSIGDPVQGNRYAYAADNPTGQVDPAGESVTGKSLNSECLNGNKAACRADAGPSFRSIATALYNGATGCLEGAEIGGAAGLTVGSPEEGAVAGCVVGAGSGQALPTQPYIGSGYPKYH